MCVSVFVQMLSCGIPELSDLEDLKYVYDALRPHESEADATMYFTRYPQTHSDLIRTSALKEHSTSLSPRRSASDTCVVHSSLTVFIVDYFQV